MQDWIHDLPSQTCLFSSFLELHLITLFLTSPHISNLSSSSADLLSDSSLIHLCVSISIIKAHRVSIISHPDFCKSVSPSSTQDYWRFIKIKDVDLMELSNLLVSFDWSVGAVLRVLRRMLNPHLSTVGKNDVTNCQHLPLQVGDGFIVCCCHLQWKVVCASDLMSQLWGCEVLKMGFGKFISIKSTDM